MEYLIGIDLGTSGTKTVLFDINGNAAASFTCEYPMDQPQNGWAEQHPSDWWNAVCTGTQNVIRSAGINAADIKGIGLSGQMHGLVMLDKDGEVIRPSILWCDGRTTAECSFITEKIGPDRLIGITANPALTGFTAGKILWVRNNEPQNYERCAHILLPKDYIRYKLTGEFATEVSDASGMNLMDIPKRKWSSEILSELGIDASLLGKMYESPEITGEVTVAAACETGLAEGTPVVGGAGDNAAAAVGTGVVSTGKAFTTIGTSGVIFAHSDSVTIDPKGRVHTFCSAVPGAWTVMSCTLAAGLSLQWFRNNFCKAEMETAEGVGVDSYILLNEQIAQVPIGSGRLLYAPWLMGERSPLLDEHARGVFFGLSAIHTKYNLLRAVMEGVTFSQRQCLDVFREMGVPFSQMLATGGGGKSPLWRQMLADVFGLNVTTLKAQEGPALGAALLAGVGTGVFSSVPEACGAVIKTEGIQQPIPENSQEYEKYYKLYKRLYPSLRKEFSLLANLESEV
ncbi:MAG: xylulokinase [Christensenellaceae bacterium]|jgi:xylulokinase